VNDHEKETYIHRRVQIESSLGGAEGAGAAELDSEAPRGASEPHQPADERPAKNFPRNEIQACHKFSQS
jgi:hypothetical protein